MAIEALEEQERRHKERQGVELPEKVRTSILFQLAPDLEASHQINALHGTQRALADAQAPPHERPGADALQHGGRQGR